MFERMLMTNTGGARVPKSLYSSPILASDGGVDWLGEVSANELITGDALASLIGLTVGIEINSNVGWLHVGLDGTELLIAKRPLRRNIRWSEINSVNVVFGGRVVNIQGIDYKIRLMKGIVNSKQTTDQNRSGYDLSQSHGSEWNRIFYRLTENVYLDSNNTKASEEPFVHLANYSEADLLVHENFGEGSYIWCQETDLLDTSRRVFRGRNGITYMSSNPSTARTQNFSWLPVLERV